MDPVTLVGVIGTAAGFATTLKHLYDRVDLYIGKSKSVPDFFETLRSNLGLIAETLESLGAPINEPNPPGYKLTPSDKLVQRLGSLLHRLDDGLSSVIPSDGDSQRVLLWKAFNSIRFEEDAASYSKGDE